MKNFYDWNELDPDQPAPAVSARLRYHGSAIELSDKHESVSLTPTEISGLVVFLRKAGIFPSSDRGPTPKASAGVKVGAKRSPKGCLDAAANGGHSTHETTTGSVEPEASCA